MMKNIKRILITVFVILISNIYTFSQCAMCRSAVESTMSNGRNNSAIGLNTGILYLLLAPYLLVATIGYLWYKTSLKNSRARAVLNNQLRNVLGK